MTNVIVSAKPWHAAMAKNMQLFCGGEWVQITTKEGFTPESLARIKPDYVFIPHWSHLIPPEIYENYKCVIFHMTDLPYGRGGSPLQNLIARGHLTTKISAIQCSDGIDNGPLFLKAPLNLEGTARQIFERSAAIIQNMIYSIITLNPKPVPQEGPPVIFRRRKKTESNIDTVDNLDELYNLIRMLDCDGYPLAYLNNNNFTFEFTDATHQGEFITASVKVAMK